MLNHIQLAGLTEGYELEIRLPGTTNQIVYLRSIYTLYKVQVLLQQKVFYLLDIHFRLLDIYKVTCIW